MEGIQDELLRTVFTYDTTPDTSDINYRVINPIVYNLEMVMAINNGNAPSSNIDVIDCADYLFFQLASFFSDNWP